MFLDAAWFHHRIFVAVSRPASERCKGERREEANSESDLERDKERVGIKIHLPSLKRRIGCSGSEGTW
jgi:hypothetical protein